MSANESSVISIIKNDDVIMLDEWCKNQDDLDIIAYFPENYPEILQHSPTILLVSAFFGSMESFKYLSNFCDVNRTDDVNRPLIAFAIAGGHFPVIKLMNEMLFPLVYTPEVKNPLHYASEFGQLEMLKYFVETKQFNVNSQDINGKTPFFYATEFGHAECIKYLLTLDEIDITIHDKVFFIESYEGVFFIF